MVCIYRKNHLARNLLRMQKRFPEFYNYFPKTYLLPSDGNEFSSQFKGKLKTFIIKPEGSAQGRGIYLIQSADQVPTDEHLIAQKYLTKPYLLDGLKFDLRVYVLVAGCVPLRIYVYKEGLARFATHQYAAPNKKNLGNTFMHLTNYAINKHSPDFKENKIEMEEEEGHKQSMSYVFERMRKAGADIDTLWNEIKKIAVKTLCMAQPQLAHCYRTAQPDETQNHMCFELLGLDILITNTCKPLLLEVNHTPSFATGSSLDSDVKSNLIHDCLKIMQVTPEMRKILITTEKIERERRVFTGKRAKVSKSDRLTNNLIIQKERDLYIRQNLGKFDEAYPSEVKYHDEPIDDFIKAAEEEYQSITGVLSKKEQVGFSVKPGGGSNAFSKVKSGPAIHEIVSEADTLANMSKPALDIARKHSQSYVEKKVGISPSTGYISRGHSIERVATPTSPTNYFYSRTNLYKSKPKETNFKIKRQSDTISQTTSMTEELNYRANTMLTKVFTSSSENKLASNEADPSTVTPTAHKQVLIQDTWRFKYVD